MGGGGENAEFNCKLTKHTRINSESPSAASEAADSIVNKRQQRLYIIFCFFCFSLLRSSEADRLSIKKRQREFSLALNSADASTVYLHNKGNFSQLPVRDTLSTYPSARLKSKKAFGRAVLLRACVCVRV